MPVMVGADVPDGATYLTRAVETPAALPDQGDQNQSGSGAANTAAGPGCGWLCGLDHTVYESFENLRVAGSGHVFLFLPGAPVIGGCVGMGVDDDEAKPRERSGGEKTGFFHSARRGFDR